MTPDKDLDPVIDAQYPGPPGLDLVWHPIVGEDGKVKQYQSLEEFLAKAEAEE